MELSQKTLKKATMKKTILIMSFLFLSIVTVGQNKKNTSIILLKKVILKEKLTVNKYDCIP